MHRVGQRNGPEATRTLGHMQGGQRIIEFCGVLEPPTQHLMCFDGASLPYAVSHHQRVTELTVAQLEELQSHWYCLLVSLCFSLIRVPTETAAILP